MSDLEKSVILLEAMESAERLKHDYAFDTDIDPCRKDPGRFERFAELFTTEGSWDDGDGEGPLQGRAAMAAKLASLKAIWKLNVGLHIVSNPRFTIDTQGIDAHWHMICALQYDGSSRPALVGGYYQERYMTENGRLRVARNETLPVFPVASADTAARED